MTLEQETMIITEDELMKTNMTVSANHYILTVLIEQDEDGYYVATVPALKSCYTQAQTREALYPRLREVIELCWISN